MRSPRLSAFALARPAALALALLLCLAGAGRAAEEVLVFAAASLKTALDEVVAGFEAETGDAVLVSYAGSSALARQIRHGAPADLFISASVEWMDAAEAARPARARVDLLGNRLVLVAHGEAGPVSVDDALDMKALLGGGRLAMGLVDAAPVGRYGKAALAALGHWEAVAPSVAQADNARAALALVASGEAPLGVVYATDARAEPGVTALGLFPEASHPPIVYPAALFSARAAPLFAYLRGDAARAAFARAGFAPLAD